MSGGGRDEAAHLALGERAAQALGRLGVGERPRVSLPRGTPRRARGSPMDYVVKLNNSPGDVCEQDVQILRNTGFDDIGIMDIVMVVSLFNFMNRVADGLGVQTEEAMEKSRERGDRRARELLHGGAAASQAGG